MEFLLARSVSAEFLLGSLLGLALLAASGGMFRWHLITWRAVQEFSQDPAELRFHKLQFRRRSQISLLLALVAVGLLGGQFLDPQAHRLGFAMLWIGLSLATLWIGLLALLDLMVIRRRGYRLTQRMLVEQGELQAEIHRIKTRHSINGNGHGTPPLP